MYFVNLNLLHVLYLLKEPLTLWELVLRLCVTVVEMTDICFNYA